MTRTADTAGLANRVVAFYHHNGELPGSGWSEDTLWWADHFDGSDEHSNTLWAWVLSDVEHKVRNLESLDSILLEQGL